MSFVIKCNKALGKTEASSVTEHKSRKLINIECLMSGVYLYKFRSI